MTILLVSRAPLERLQAYKRRMGWTIDWVSTAGSDFNRDFGFTNTEEEGFGQRLDDPRPFWPRRHDEY